MNSVAMDGHKSAPKESPSPLATRRSGTSAVAMAGKSTNVAAQTPVVSQAMVVQALKAMTSKVCAPGICVIPAEENFCNVTEL